MEPILNKLQEGVKYPSFERDATRIINDLVSHITKERGVYSSSIEPNPNEHKVWFNTNTNTLNIYENGRWNTISGSGGGGGNTEYLNGVKNITMNSGFITGVSEITFVSGSNAHTVRSQGNVIAYNGTLSDTTLMHSIDFVYGDVKGIKSIKGDWSGLSIEPVNNTLTGKPIIIHGRAAGLTIGADSTAPFVLSGVSSIGWKNGSSYGYMMTFNVNDNIINSTRDTYNINSGSITLTNETITGSANVNLTLSGTINALNTTIEFPVINSPSISGGNFNNPTIMSGFIIGSVTLAGIISGGTISGVTLTGNINATNCIISGATISGGTISEGVINNVTIGTGNVLLYAGSKVLVTYTGNNSNPILIPKGGNIGDNSSSLTLCGVTLTGGDFTKLKNLQ